MIAKGWPNTADRKGFTLIELAIVLVIVGLLVGLGTSMVGVLTTAIKVRETKDLQDAVVQSVNSWASANNSVPNTAGFTSVAKNPNDAWGRPFIYLYDNTLNINPTKDTICGRRSTLLTVVDNSISPAPTISNVAFVVISGSDDANFQYTLTGTGNLNGGALNIGTSGYITNGPVTVTIDANNSDIVRWVTLDELRSKVGCQGAPLKIVNNELPFGNASNPYSVTILADGGATPTTLRWCIEAATTTPLPSGLAFSTTTPAITVQTSPTSTCNGPTSPLAEPSWGLGTLSITGTPLAGSQGSYSFTVYVRDNNDPSGANDNIASKPFVLTINPN